MYLSGTSDLRASSPRTPSVMALRLEPCSQQQLSHWQHVMQQGDGEKGVGHKRARAAAPVQPDAAKGSIGSARARLHAPRCASPSLGNEAQ